MSSISASPSNSGPNSARHHRNKSRHNNKLPPAEINSIPANAPSNTVNVHYTVTITAKFLPTALNSANELSAYDYRLSFGYNFLNFPVTEDFNAEITEPMGVWPLSSTASGAETPQSGGDFLSLLWTKEFRTNLDKTKLIELAHSDWPICLQEKSIKLSTESPLTSPTGSNSRPSSKHANIHTESKPKPPSSHRKKRNNGAEVAEERKSLAHSQLLESSEVNFVAVGKFSGDLSNLLMKPFKVQLNLAQDELPAGLSLLEISLQSHCDPITAEIRQQLKPIQITVNSIEGITTSPCASFAQINKLYRPLQLQYDLFGLQSIYHNAKAAQNSESIAVENSKERPSATKSRFSRSSAREDKARAANAAAPSQNSPRKPSNLSFPLTPSAPIVSKPYSHASKIFLNWQKVFLLGLLGEMNGGGSENCLASYCSHLEREKIQFIVRDRDRKDVATPKEIQEKYQLLAQREREDRQRKELAEKEGKKNKKANNSLKSPSSKEIRETNSSAELGSGLANNFSGEITETEEYKEFLSNFYGVAAFDLSALFSLPINLTASFSIPLQPHYIFPSAGAPAPPPANPTHSSLTQRRNHYGADSFLNISLQSSAELLEFLPHEWLHNYARIVAIVPTAEEESYREIYEEISRINCAAFGLSDSKLSRNLLQANSLSYSEKEAKSPADYISTLQFIDSTRRIIFLEGLADKTAFIADFNAKITKKRAELQQNHSNLVAERQKLIETQAKEDEISQKGAAKDKKKVNLKGNSAASYEIPAIPPPILPELLNYTAPSALNQLSVHLLALSSRSPGFSVLFNPDLSYSGRFSPFPGPGVTSIPLISPLESLLQRNKQYITGQLDQNTLHSLLKLQNITLAPRLLALNNDFLWPNRAEIIALQRYYAVPVTEFHLFGEEHPAPTFSWLFQHSLQEEKQNFAPKTGENSLKSRGKVQFERNNAPRKAKLSQNNENYAAAKGSAQVLSQDKDFIAQNIEKIAQLSLNSPENNKSRREINENHIGPVYLYGNQAQNYWGLAQQQLREEFKSDPALKNAVFTYSQQFLSGNFPLIDAEQAVKELNRAKVGKLSIPGHKTSLESNKPRIKLQESELQELKQPYYLHSRPENSLFRDKFVPTEQNPRFSTEFSYSGAESGEFYRSVHLPREGLAQEASAAAAEERRQWREKVVVESERFSVYWGQNKYGEYSKEKKNYKNVNNQTEKLTGMLKDKAKKLGLIAPQKHKARQHIL
jgi:hypothetical protein